MTSSSPLAVVLLHGAWHGPWCWEAVESELAARGITTHAPALPSTAGDPADLGGFDDDVAAVHATLDRSGPAVVCAHSYAGLVAGAVTHPALHRLVFLSAFVADTDETWADVAAGDGEEGQGGLADAIAVTDDGYVVVDPARAVDLFYADCDPAAAATAVARLSPQNPEPFTRTMPRPSWRSVPSTFVVCEHDRAISPARQRALGARTGATITLPTSHSAMLARPDLVADVLEAEARSEPRA
ncbi:MAG TPA: alpha/beta hydrolase [Acidimicrobiales bacterium]